MLQQMIPEAALASCELEQMERRVMELALESTGARNGGVFLWDEHSNSLTINWHVVEGLRVKLPEHRVRRRTDGRPNGIALWVLDNDRSYLCRDTRSDPHYARYFVEVRSIIAVPIPYGGRPMGVLTVASREPHAFDVDDQRRLERLAHTAAKYLRRMQMDRASRESSGRPFLIWGMSPQWQEVERRIENVSPTTAPVLIQGESGTGKDLVAHAVHFNSDRSEAPFITLNCAAIPETMLESMLFGHVKGAFTGASFDKIGEFKKAHGGTLFLDEIGELPLALQAKVLRAVETGEIQPLGSNKAPETVDVRLVCATHRDLASMVRAGDFRDDLFYRLTVMTMELPPLRHYKDNLEALAHVFVEQAAHRHGRRSPHLSSATLVALHAYDYPGNVRELKNALEHAVIMCEGDTIEPQHLPRSITHDEPLVTPVLDEDKPRATLREMRERWLGPLERRYLEELLTEHDGNVRAAAEVAGVNVVTMYRLMKKRGIELTREVRRAG